MTNVPGPRVPVYLLGARQLETYPVVPLLAHQALGIALMSYDDGLFWGFNADWDAVPDLHELVGYVEAGFRQLRRRLFRRGRRLRRERRPVHARARQPARRARGRRRQALADRARRGPGLRPRNTVFIHASKRRGATR